jgi:membrane protein insertase Oxa1/YidC/SpoIIIJ
MPRYAKEVAKVDAYEADRGIRQFELLIDWGWFYFITKPMFWLIDNLYKILGNFGLAILATTVVVKAVFFPLANKSYKSMAKMKVVQPKMLEIREKYADDKMKQQQAMMELYKTREDQSAGGLLADPDPDPGLLRALQGAVSSPSRCATRRSSAGSRIWRRRIRPILFNLFGLLPFAPPAFLPHLGVWPIIMGITMFLQMKLNPAPPDPTQADDLQLDAADLHLHAGVVPGRPGDLLGLEQPAVDHPAGRHHEAPRRKDRTVGQSCRAFPQETQRSQVAPVGQCGLWLTGVAHSRFDDCGFHEFRSHGSR